MIRRPWGCRSVAAGISRPGAGRSRRAVRIAAGAGAGALVAGLGASGVVGLLTLGAAGPTVAAGGPAVANGGPAVVAGGAAVAAGVPAGRSVTHDGGSDPCIIAISYLHQWGICIQPPTN